MSIAYAEDDQTYPSYEVRLRAEREARLAKWKLAGVFDAGIDLKRKPEDKPVSPAAEVVPLAPPEPIVWRIDECAAWMAAEHTVLNSGYCTRRIAPARVIVAIVGNHFNISRIDLISPRRTHNIVRPRQIGMYLVKMLTGGSLPSIGRLFGDRDHTTVLSAVRKIHSLLGDPYVSGSIKAIAAKLASNGFDISPLNLPPAILSQAGMDIEPLMVAG